MVPMKPAAASVRFALLMLCIGLAGVWIISFTTRWGIGLFGWDSFNYIAGARNLAQGNGYVFPYQSDQLAPITHFPPGLSSILAIFERLGLDALLAARGFNMVLFGLSAALVGLTVRTSNQSPLFGILGALLFLSSSTMVEIYSLAMSEGFYLFLTLLGFLLLNEGLERNRRYALVAAVLLFGAAGLTRFVGVANVAAAVLAYLLWSKKKLLQKTGEAALFGLIGLLPAIWWAVRTYSFTATFNDRQFGFHPPVQKNYFTAVRTIYTWVLPERFVAGYEALYGIILLAGLSGAILFFSWYGIRKTGFQLGRFRSLDRPRFLVFLYAGYLLLYLAAIFAAKTFLDPAIGMSTRMLSPLLPGLIVVGLSFLNSLWRSGFLPLRGLSMAAAAYLLFFNLYFARYTIAEFHEKGLGLGRAEVQNSEVVQALPDLIQTYRVYSNDPYTLYFYTGQVGYRINGFSPEELPSGSAVLAIFGEGEKHPIYQKYSDRLELLIEDPLASLYLFE
jgi:Dolichyl-phosphate-mannose-protein mannosyltransferase